MKYNKITIVKPTPSATQVPADRLVNVTVGDGRRVYIGDDKEVYIDRRNAGCFTGKALYLNSKFDWVLGLDDEKCLVLIPVAKK